MSQSLFASTPLFLLTSQPVKTSAAKQKSKTIGYSIECPWEGQSSSKQAEVSSFELWERPACSVGCEQKGCSREGPVTKAPTFPSCTRKFFHLNWNVVCEKECIRRDTMTGMVARYHQRNGKQRWISCELSFLWLAASKVLWAVVWRVYVCSCEKRLLLCVLELFAACASDHSWCRWAKSCSSPADHFQLLCSSYTTKERKHLPVMINQIRSYSLYVNTPCADWLRIECDSWKYNTEISETRWWWIDA